MAHVIYIVNANIVTKIAAYDRAVIQTNCHTKIMKFTIHRRQTSDTHKSKKFTISYKAGIKRVGDENPVPVIRSVPVIDKCIYFVRCKRPVNSVVAVLYVPQVVFIFPFGNVFFFNKIITKFFYGMCLNNIHEFN